MLHWFSKRINELHKEDRKGEKGFTLIELLVVVIIIGILAAIAIPVFLGQRADAADARARANVRTAATAVQAYITDTGNAPTAIGDLNSYGFQQTTPAVSMTASGSGSGATFCVASTTDGGNVASFKMDQTDGAPEAGNC